MVKAFRFKHLFFKNDNNECSNRNVSTTVEQRKYIFFSFKTTSGGIYSLRPIKYETFDFRHKVLCRVVLWINENRIK